VNVMPWIDEANPYYGVGAEELYRRLVAKYLNPRPRIMRDIDEFYVRHLAGGPFVAVHVRGAEKAFDQRQLAEINASYFEHVDRALADARMRLFVLSDVQ